MSFRDFLVHRAGQGHFGGEEMVARLVEATNRFAGIETPYGSSDSTSEEATAAKIARRES